MDLQTVHRLVSSLTDDELAAELAEMDKRMESLQPYNGTAPGARAISSLYNQREAVKHEIALRKAGL